MKILWEEKMPDPIENKTFKLLIFESAKPGVFVTIIELL